MTNRERLWVLILVTGGLLVLTVFVRVAGGAGQQPVVVVESTYQGKGVRWWARHAVQARKDANARRATVIRLRRSLEWDPTIQEAVKLATIAYPSFSEARAWRIIRHESWMTADPLHARNPSSSATGLYQFLVSTFNSTPYRGMSIYSPYAQSLAAGWMHEHGRGCEWDIDC